MIGEILSKVAIVVTFISLAQVGYVSGVAAVSLGALGVVASFFRDANLRRRGIIRKLPALGWVWALSLLVAVPLMAAVRLLADREVLNVPSIFVMAGIVSIGVRVICIGVEGCVDWIFTIIWPLLDRVVASIPGTSPASDQATVHSPQEYRTVLTEPLYDAFVPPANWRYQCPRCGARVEHKIDVCWNCKYGADGPLGSP